MEEVVLEKHVGGFGGGGSDGGMANRPAGSETLSLTRWLALVSIKPAHQLKAACVNAAGALTHRREEGDGHLPHSARAHVTTLMG